MSAGQSLLFVLLFCLVILIYALMVMKLATLMFSTETSVLFSSIFYLIAGLAWVLPAWGIFRLIARKKKKSANKA